MEGGSSYQHTPFVPTQLPFLPIQQKIELSTRVRIIDGNPAEPNEFPHQIRLVYNGATICSGTIINTIFILTAAHCFLGENFSRNRKGFLVIAGDHHRFELEGPEQKPSVLHIYSHEEYNNVTRENDIGILVLSEPLEFNASVKSIPLPKTSHPEYIGNATVSGWGLTKNGLYGTLAEVLQKNSVPFIVNEECRKSHQKIGNLVTNKMLCAGSNGSDACLGDSGGPLMCTEKESNTSVLCGFVSFGLEKCGHPGYPGVYTDVSQYLDWIERKILRHSYCGGLLVQDHNRPEIYRLGLNPIQKDAVQVICDANNENQTTIANGHSHLVRVKNIYEGHTKCGGTILSRIFILTAATCLINQKFGQWKVLAGDHNKNLHEDSEQIRTVSQAYVHEDFNSTTFENDIALLVLSEPLELNEHVQNMPYPKKKNTAYDSTLNGWGQISERNQRLVNIPKNASISLVSHFDCKKNYKITNTEIKETMLCGAGSPENDACRGDGGSPLILTETVTGKRVVGGIVSHGVGCGRPEFPGVYTDVSQYSLWIERTMLNHGDNCKKISKGWDTGSGVFGFAPFSPQTQLFQVYCDMEYDGGGWNVIQRRGVSLKPNKQRESFNRSWTEYENGFGSPHDDYWIGLRNMHLLTSKCENELTITLKTWTGTEFYAKYSNFQVAGEHESYRLTIGNWTNGTIYNDGLKGMEINDGMKFTTFDHDNDNWKDKNCAIYMQGAWWHNKCTYVNLNGEYAEDGSNGTMKTIWTEIFWIITNRLPVGLPIGPHYSFMKSEMKIRPKCPSARYEFYNHEKM